MAHLSLRKLVSLLPVFLTQATSSPVVGPRSLYAEHALRSRSSLNIKRTTTTAHNVIDWVPIEDQGEIASAPPVLFRIASTNGTKPVAELQQAGAQVGPAGTVPIPQVSPDYLNNVAEKSLPERPSSAKSKRQNSGAHWYVSSNQGVSNQGGYAVYSLFSPYVNNGGDFSLLQTAVTHDSSAGGQTLEAGWINYPNQVSSAHLFTFYTINGYSNLGDNRGGWNRDVAGWVQVDSQIFPGTVFSPNSADGGTQYEIQIEYQLFEGNWWLWVLDRWIGYYPASLFSNGISGTTLATGSDNIYYYGEIYQNEGPLTNTDMGSGRFGTTGFGHSAYIHNMVYRDSSGSYHDFATGFWDSDSNRYNHQNGIDAASGWNSYVYLGGPGSGGVTGG